MTSPLSIRVSRTTWPQLLSYWPLMIWSYVTVPFIRCVYATNSRGLKAVIKSKGHITNINKSDLMSTLIFSLSCSHSKVINFSLCIVDVIKKTALINLARHCTFSKNYFKFDENYTIKQRISCKLSVNIWTYFSYLVFSRTDELNWNINFWRHFSLYDHVSKIVTTFLLTLLIL